jgi:hypothetical protein
MKKSLFLLFAVNSIFVVFGQVTMNLLPTNASANGQNPNPNAYCGIGTVPLNALPVQNLQIHGVNNYVRTVEPGKIIVGPEGDMGGMPLSVNFGVTSAISLTNTTTGASVNDGAILRMSEKTFTIDNLEADGNIVLAASGANMIFQGATKRIYTGGTLFSINNQQATFNIWGGNTNALNIRTSGSNGNGISIATSNSALAIYDASAINMNFSVAGNGQTFARKLKITNTNTSDNSIEVFEANGTSRNFSVNGLGQVFARKYTTTLANIPDYVFEKDYQLMPLKELKSYIRINKHLPNIPSAREIEANEGQVDLGEMNRLLLEKVEESMLYILQLEERIKALEEKKK